MVDLRKEGGKVFLASDNVPKSNITVKMTDETFNKISKKELSGFKAFVTGRLSLKGDLGMLKKFEKEVINKY